MCLQYENQTTKILYRKSMTSYGYHSLPSLSLRDELFAPQPSMITSSPCPGSLWPTVSRFKDPFFFCSATRLLCCIDHCPQFLCNLAFLPSTRPPSCFFVFLPLLPFSLVLRDLPPPALSPSHVGYLGSHLSFLFFSLEGSLLRYLAQFFNQ